MKNHKILLAICLWTTSIQLYSQGLTLTSGVYDVNSLTYDKNGNINTLKRQGLINGTASILDDLYFTYTGDQLKIVKDMGSSDIFNDRVSAMEEFMYDANGNMVKDLNKEIDTIYYNILNLPDTVIFNDGRKVVYTYLSNGTKIKHEVLGSSGKRVSLKKYSGNVVYSDAVAEEVLGSFGKIAFTKQNEQGVKAGYQYFLQDHLGNNRMVITPDIKTDSFTADYEDATDNDFANYGAVKRVNSTLYNNTTGGSYSGRLSGVDGETIGLAKSLAVFPGDTVRMEVYAKYFANAGGATNIASNMLSAITSAFGITADPGGEGEIIYETFEALFGFGPIVDNSTADGDPPAAYLNYLYFDRNYNLVDMGYDRISEASKEDGSGTSVHERLHLQAVITQPGYLYIYLSNENNFIQDVYFDDLQVEHKQSPVVQETHYYPFGEAITDLSYTREGAKNDYLYNGKELDSATQWHDYGARHYDAQLARWHAIDPLAEEYSSWSPYNYVMNNPVNMIDPDGRNPVVAILGRIVGQYFGAKVAEKYGQVYKQEASSLISRAWSGFWNLPSHAYGRVDARSYQQALRDKAKENAPNLSKNDQIAVVGEVQQDLVNHVNNSEELLSLGESGLSLTEASVTAAIETYTPELIAIRAEEKALQNMGLMAPNDDGSPVTLEQVRNRLDNVVGAGNRQTLSDEHNIQSKTPNAMMVISEVVQQLDAEKKKVLGEFEKALLGSPKCTPGSSACGGMAIGVDSINDKR
ncbi:hypothetical protein C900_05904 [Fulvivirga imtechensis AK7]|uniref:RHS repeat-associated core domain-containing protein n=1 Tax=Fulvivirga imtechensis AK7 TaxID=1237149 RepID=L8JIL5_9BACT|nr:RHS repeat-associated core domain-containing protein [Fulvivirga imtechensis]ELR68721.1 hypothetical protein C900_05904 [Fulvivirga imtechensis AK7]